MILVPENSGYTGNRHGELLDWDMLHGRPIIRTGHCKKCDQETLHSHHSSGVVRLFHFLTLQLFPRLGIGRWVCIDCYSERFFLGSSGQDHSGALEKKKVFEIDGNYIVSDFSLVRRSLRNSRYSMKFRDSIVDRLVSGQVDLPTLRSELRIREADVFVWIADRLNRQSEKISQLSSLLEILAGQQDHQLLETSFELETGTAAREEELRRTTHPVDMT